MSKIGFRSLCLLAVAFIVIAGCSKDVKPDGFPKLYPCKITLVQAGQPVAGAAVSMVSKDGKNSRWPVTGVTDETGVAAMVTYGKFKGAPEGEWSVTVIKTVTEDEEGNVVVRPKKGDGPPPSPFAERRNVTIFSLVPVEYGETETTSLTLTTSGKTETQFDLGEPLHIEIEKSSVPY